jgi:hypothetical protein
MTTASLTTMDLKALAYIRNTGGNATRAQFDEDQSPIGPRLWANLDRSGLVTVDARGKVQLTQEGKQILTQNGM